MHTRADCQIVDHVPSPPRQCYQVQIQLCDQILLTPLHGLGNAAQCSPAMNTSTLAQDKNQICLVVQLTKECKNHNDNLAYTINTYIV